jgi:hypothetical protein
MHPPLKPVGAEFGELLRDHTRGLLWIPGSIDVSTLLSARKIPAYWEWLMLWAAR